MVDINPTISIITLNVNGLKVPIKRQRLSEWIKNTTQLCLVYKKPTLNIKTNRLKVNEWRKIYHVINTYQKSWSGYINFRQTSK